MVIQRIVSGGQTGVDRAALDVARELGVPSGGFWRELLNSDASCYGGSGQGNLGGIEAAPVSASGRYHSLNATLPPLSVVVFREP